MGFEGRFRRVKRAQNLKRRIRNCRPGSGGNVGCMCLKIIRNAADCFSRPRMNAHHPAHSLVALGVYPPCIGLAHAGNPTAKLSLLRTKGIRELLY